MVGLPVDARRELLLARVRTTAAQLRANESEHEELMAHRLDLWEQLRSLDPPTPRAVCAEVAGVSEHVVSRALNRPRREALRQVS